MFAEHPAMAKRWAEHTPDIGALPEKVDDKEEKKASEPGARPAAMFGAGAQMAGAGLGGLGALATLVPRVSLPSSPPFTHNGQYAPGQAPGESTRPPPLPSPPLIQPRQLNPNPNPLRMLDKGGSDLCTLLGQLSLAMASEKASIDLSTLDNLVKGNPALSRALLGGGIGALAGGSGSWLLNQGREEKDKKNPLGGALMGGLAGAGLGAGSTLVPGMEGTAPQPPGVTLDPEGLPGAQTQFFMPGGRHGRIDPGPEALPDVSKTASAMGVGAGAGGGLFGPFVGAPLGAIGGAIGAPPGRKWEGAGHGTLRGVGAGVGGTVGSLAGGLGGALLGGGAGAGIGSMINSEAGGTHAGTGGLIGALAGGGLGFLGGAGLGAYGGYNLTKKLTGRTSYEKEQEERDKAEPKPSKPPAGKSKRKEASYMSNSNAHSSSWEPVSGTQIRLTTKTASVTVNKAQLLAVARPLVLHKLAQLTRRQAQTKIAHFLDKLAESLPIEKQAALRVLQQGLSVDKNLATAIKEAYPHLTGEARGILALQLVKASAEFGAKPPSQLSSEQPNSTSAIPTQGPSSWHGPARKAKSQFAKMT